MTWSEQFVEEFKRRHVEEAVPWIEQRTVVVCEVDRDVLVPNFTAVLLQVGQRPFVLTAAHCLNNWGQSRFWIVLPDQDYVDLTTVQAEVPKDRLMDFTLLPLTSEMAFKLSGFRSFIQLSEVDVSTDVARSSGDPAAVDRTLTDMEIIEHSSLFA